MKEEEIPIDFQSLKKELTVIVAIMSIRNFKVTVMQIAFNWGRLSEITIAVSHNPHWFSPLLAGTI